MQDLLPWFTLKSVPGVGNLLFKRLIDRFGSPEAVLKAPAEALTAVEGISRQCAEAVRCQRPSTAVVQEIARIAESGVSVVTLLDPGYPSLLRQIPDPPPFLYFYGSLAGLVNPVAVVGSRHATQYGLEATERLCRDLTARGMTVVSGMARGIDTAAHRGALAGRGRTVAVLGSGLQKIYPLENRHLFERIAANGAVVSEFPLRAAPDPHHFPQRNRIISGMTLGTVIVEATLRSGSLITARLAAEQNREVFAVPGNINSFKSTGTHTLIKQGAKLVEHAGDIVEELQALLQEPSAATAPLSDVPLAPQAPTREQQRVLAALDPYPQHIDDLARRLELGSGQLAGILLQLELAGHIRQMPGKRFTRDDRCAGGGHPPASVRRR